MLQHGDFPPPQSDDEKREVPLFDKDFENLLKTDPNGEGRFPKKKDSDDEPDVILGTPPRRNKAFFPNEKLLAENPLPKKKISFDMPKQAVSPPIKEVDNNARKVHFLAQPIQPGKKIKEIDFDRNGIEILKKEELFSNINNDSSNTSQELPNNNFEIDKADNFWNNTHDSAITPTIQSNPTSSDNLLPTNNDLSNEYSGEPSNSEEYETDYAPSEQMSPRRVRDDNFEITNFTGDDLITDPVFLFREMDRVSKLDPKDIQDDDDEPPAAEYQSVSSIQPKMNAAARKATPMKPTKLQKTQNTPESEIVDQNPEENTEQEQNGMPKNETELYDFILNRISNLTMISSQLFPDVTDEYLLVKNLAAKGSRYLEMTILDDKIRILKSDNEILKEQLANQPKPNMESIKLKREIQNAKKIIERLRKGPPPKIPITNSLTVSNHPEIGHPVSMQAHIMKEKRKVEEIQNQISSLRENLEKLNKRIALMSQTKSSYTYDPSLSPSKSPQKMKLKKKKLRTKKSKLEDKDTARTEEKPRKKLKSKKSKKSKAATTARDEESNMEAVSSTIPEQSTENLEMEQQETPVSQKKVKRAKKARKSHNENQ